MDTSSRRLSKTLLTNEIAYIKPPFMELFITNPSLLSNLLRFVPWRTFLSLSQTCRVWRSFFDVHSAGGVRLRNVILTRYVAGFGKALRDAGPNSLALRDDFGVELCWEDLVLLLISQQTPLHTYPTHALSVLSSNLTPETSRTPRGSLKTARLARLTIAHSRFVLVLQSISHSSSSPPPQEDESPIPSPGNSHLKESFRDHQRASSAGSARELIFPTPLTVADHPAILASKSMTSVNVIPPARSSSKLSKGRSGSRSAPSTARSGSSNSISSGLSTPGTPKPSRRMSVASFLGKSSRAPPPPVPEPRALRAYSSSFGWRRGISDAKGRWENKSAYIASDFLHRETAEDMTGYGSEIDDDELFSTPRRRFVGSDGGVSGSESSFSEGTGSTVSSSTSASNSTSATSISLDSPPQLLQKESLSGAEVLAINRGRVRPANAEVSPTRSGSASRSRPISQSTTLSDITPPHSSSSGTKSGLSSRTSTLGPGTSRRPVRSREHLRSAPSATGLDPDRNNPHALRQATSRIRAPILRVFVPSSDMNISSDTDTEDGSGVSMCEEELLKANLWDHLSVGDVVCNLGYVPSSTSPSHSAVWLVYNGYRLVPLAPGAKDGSGVLPVYTTPGATEGEGQEAWALPSWAYYEHLLQQDTGARPGLPGQKSNGVNMRILLSKIPLSPLDLNVHEPMLISVPTRIPSPHTPGGIVVVKKWVWTVRVLVGSSLHLSSSIVVGSEYATEVGPGWEGEWVLEVDGTKEGKEILLSCLRQEQEKLDLMEWELVRERCGRGKVCLRLLDSSASIPQF